MTEHLGNSRIGMYTLYNLEKIGHRTHVLSINEIEAKRKCTELIRYFYPNSDIQYQFEWDTFWNEGYFYDSWDRY